MSYFMKIHPVRELFHTDGRTDGRTDGGMWCNVTWRGLVGHRLDTTWAKVLRLRISWKSIQWEQSCFIRTDGQTEGCGVTWLDGDWLVTGWTRRGPKCLDFEFHENPDSESRIVSYGRTYGGMWYNVTWRGLVGHQLDTTWAKVLRLRISWKSRQREQNCFLRTDRRRDVV